MSKIKDSIDLKELEKFGFEYFDEFEEEGVFIKEIQNGYAKIIIDENDRCIEIMGFNDTPSCSFILQDLDILYDLIKADMVEVVEK